MFEYKLQVGCMIIFTFIVINYVKEIYSWRVKCSKLFVALLYAAPVAIISDGLSAWTVNHMDTIPGWLNTFSHGILLVSMDVTTVIIFLYVLNLTMWINDRNTIMLLISPGIVTLLLIIYYINDLTYIIGQTTNYSSGKAVNICFGSLFLHFVGIGAVLAMHRRAIERKKLVTIVIFMVGTFGLLIAQLIFPEILMTSVLPTMIVVSLYVNFENPAMKKLEIYNTEMVTGFATLVENRDSNTGGHIHRTQAYVAILLENLWKIAKYRDTVTKDYTTDVANAAPLHDIGKIATPDSILQKPGKLTDEEFTTMKQHAAIGGDMIKKLFVDINDPQYTEIAYEMTRHHHEKWNGKGYPDGLKGEDIPLHARIMAIADVFDAVSAKRCYRDAMPLHKCFKIIEEGSGIDFDPELVSLFLDSKDEIVDYYNKSKEQDSDLQ